MHTRARLCVTVTAKTMADLRLRRDAVVGADLVELRLDGIRDVDVAAALAGRALPVIVTCRAAWEGGWFGGSEEERHRILADAIDSDAEYVDLEFAAGFEDLIARRQGRGVVVSMHDFRGIPADVEARATAMARTGAEIVKVAVSVERLADNGRVLALARQFDPGRAVILAMGPRGLVSRVCAARFGNAWTYAGDAVAPGQVGLATMLSEYGYRRLHAGSPLYGVAGLPLGHTLSPAIHAAGFAALGLDGAYLPLPAVDLDDLLSFADTFDVQGLSVTAPFKSGVFERVPTVTAAARAVGAANTLTRRQGAWVAHNTDVEGFLMPLGAIDLPRTRATILGNGGAARAVAYGLTSRGATVTLAGRDLARTQAVAQVFGAAAVVRPVLPRTWDLLVNTTPVGTHPEGHVSAFPEATYDGSCVYDLVYNPRDTAMLSAARQDGCQTIGGLEMLVQQARLQQQEWFGAMPPAEPLCDAAARKLAAFASVV